MENLLKNWEVGEVKRRNKLQIKGELGKQEVQ